MTGTWKEHCPYDSEEHPARRYAWRRGWVFRKNHGPVKPAKETGRILNVQVHYSSWLQGYSAADEHLQEAKPEVQQ